MVMKFNLRRTLFFLIVLILGFIFISHLGQFKSFLHTLKEADLWILATIVIARYIYYWANARYFMVTFGFFDGKISFRRAMEATLVYNFLNNIIPAAGATGISYIAREFRDDVKTSVASAVQIAWYAFTYTGYIFLLLLGILALSASSRLHRLSFKAVFIAAIVIAVIVILIGIVVINYERAKKVAWQIARPVNWVLRKLKKHPIERQRLDNFLQEFYDSFRLLLTAKWQLWRPLWYCFLTLSMEIVSIYIVFLSLGRVINPGEVIIAYGLAIVTSTFGIFTGGVGVYEVVMTGTFVALGESFGTAFAAVIIYRVIAFWLFIPVGLHYYRKQSLSREAKSA